MNGKGDKKRPIFVSHKKVRENWDMIFKKLKKDKEKKEVKKCTEQ